ncbi:MAG: hypothetical protein SPF31_05905 [Lactobacillus delbrueckii]|nr:hypothetical protein [Lactobacillus delbrueckii]
MSEKAVMTAAELESAIDRLADNNDSLTKWMLKHRKNGLIHGLLKFQAKNPTLYQFLVFNILSNCATVTNFVVLWLSTLLFFKHITQPFKWFIFDYSKPSTGGLGGFYSFILAYVCAQVVNYFVQRDVVFGAEFGKAKLFWYVVTVVFAGIVSVWMPPHIIAVLSPKIGNFSATVANICNIIAQVVINWPMMKFVIMK